MLIPHHIYINTNLCCLHLLPSPLLPPLPHLPCQPGPSQPDLCWSMGQKIDQRSYQGDIEFKKRKKKRYLKQLYFIQTRQALGEHRPPNRFFDCLLLMEVVQLNNYNFNSNTVCIHTYTHIGDSKTRLHDIGCFVIKASRSYIQGSKT